MFSNDFPYFLSNVVDLYPENNFQCYLFIYLHKAFLSFIFSLGLEIHFQCYLNKVFRGINKKHSALHHLEEEHII